MKQKETPPPATPATDPADGPPLWVVAGCESERDPVPVPVLSELTFEANELVFGWSRLGVGVVVVSVTGTGLNSIALMVTNEVGTGDSEENVEAVPESSVTVFVETETVAVLVFSPSELG